MKNLGLIATLILVFGFMRVVSAENAAALNGQAAAPVSTFIINSTADLSDANPIDGQCIASNGMCTLRAAIEEANRDATHDNIQFNFTSATSILPETALPRIVWPITIDGIIGTTASCATGTNPANLKITLSGINTPDNSDGLILGQYATGSKIKGLNIVLFQNGGAGIRIDPNSDGNRIVCNHIGLPNLDVAGFENSTGIIIESNSNVVGDRSYGDRNVIVGGVGILINEPTPYSAENNEIGHNFIGTNRAGTAILGTMAVGIDVSGDNNSIGTTLPQFGNIVGGATSIGIKLGVTGQSNTIINNKVGVAVNTVDPIPNEVGIAVVQNSTRASNNVIGIPSEPNQIAFNLASGIALERKNTTVSHNLIHNNGLHGVRIGLQADTTNLIEHNSIFNNGGHGIYHGGTNFMGGDVTSNYIYGNGDSGIFVVPSSPPFDIVANTIYGNGDDGITVASKFYVRENNIYENGDLGYDVGDDGVSESVVPTLLRAETSGRIVGETDANGAGSTAQIEVFLNDSCSEQLVNGVPYGEGQTYHGTIVVTGLSSGLNSFEGYVPAIPADKFVTITERQGFGGGVTSEFSACIPTENTRFIVNSTSNTRDADLGDGQCDIGSAGICTLPAAIDEVNALGAGPHRIEFDLPGDVRTISIVEPLVLTAAATIDASTPSTISCPSSNAPATLNIQLDGAALTGDKSILTLAKGSDGSTVRGLAFIGGPADGLRISSDNNLVGCNLFGVRVDHVAAGNGDDGVHIQGGDHNQIGTSLGLADYPNRNVFADNSGAAVRIDGKSIGNSVSGNYIGLHPAGTLAISNDYGIDIADGSDDTTVGGAEAHHANYIAGNSNDGIHVSTSSLVTVTENIVGQLPTGVAAGNGRYGVSVMDASTVSVGSTMSVLEAGNLIRASGSHAVYIADSSDVIVQANTLFGSGSGGNGSGVAVLRSSNVTIGGFTSGISYGNVIYDNVGSGIYLHDSVTNVVIDRNRIGYDSAIGNLGGNSFDGIHANESVTDVTVSNNHIGFNNRNGIRVDNDATGIVMLGNSITSNGSIGIDLGEDGVTDNDAPANYDGDSGANGKTNFPIITQPNADTQRVAGYIYAKPSTQYEIQFFKNNSCDGTHGEGMSLSKVTTVTTSVLGYAEFEAFSGSPFAAGDVMTGTATEIGGDGTSEFSPCVVATGSITTAATLRVGAAATDGHSLTTLWLVLLFVTLVMGLFRPNFHYRPN